MKLLHVDSSILGATSVSRQLSGAIVSRLAAGSPGLDVTYRDLAATPLPHLTLAHMAGGEPSSEDAAESRAVLDEFLSADVIVIGAPMYNFTISSQLKAWIDRILVAGYTFRYSETGVQGLAGDRRVIVALSRGGLYGPDTPAAALEHVETYLRGVFGFIGIVPEFILAEGLQIAPEQRVAAIDAALTAVGELNAA